MDYEINNNPALAGLNSQLKIVDISGRVIYKQSISGTTGKEIIDASALSNGMYFWEITNEKGVIGYGKIAIEK